MTFEAILQDAEIQDLIWKCARGAARRTRGHGWTAEDWQQELNLELRRRLADFQPEKSSLRYFLRLLLDHGVASRLRYLRAAKRAPVRTTVELPTLEATGDLLESTVHQYRLGIQPRSAAELHDLVAAVRSTLESLPPDLRRVAHCLSMHGIRTTARICALTVSQLATARQHIRKYLESADLWDFGSKPSSA